MRSRSQHSLRAKTDILCFNFLTTLTFNFYFAPKFRIKSPFIYVEIAPLMVFLCSFSVDNFRVKPV